MPVCRARASCGPARRLMVPSCLWQPQLCGHIATGTVRCCETWGHVGQCFDNFTFQYAKFFALGQVIGGLTRGNSAEEEDVIYNLPWSQTEKDKALAKCRRRNRAWEDADESRARLGTHWTGIFEHERVITRTTLRGHSRLRSKGPRQHTVEVMKTKNVTRCKPQRRSLPRVLTDRLTVCTGVQEN